MALLRLFFTFSISVAIFFNKDTFNFETGFKNESTFIKFTIEVEKVKKNHKRAKFSYTMKKKSFKNNQN